MRIVLRAALVGAMLAPAAVAFVPAHAGNATAIADSYSDGMNTRRAAQAFMDAAAATGYAGSAYTNGRTADGAFADAKAAQVFGYFGHADPGFFLVKEMSSASANELIYAGATEIERVAPYAGTRAWREYTPFVDMDDVKLAVLAGCRTARKDPATQNDFVAVAKAIGIDALVTFFNDVFYPAGCSGVACEKSGNYYWMRAAHYLEAGRTVSTALAWARTDLIDLEGKDSGWGSYRITGTVADPGAVRLTPAGASGQALTSQTQALSPIPVPDPALSTRLAPQPPADLTLRTDPLTGRLVDAVGTPSLAGVEAVGATDAIATVRAFASEQLPEVALDGAPIVHQTSHGDGQAFWSLEWRPAAGEVVVAEVDRRTGGIVYFTAAEAPNRSGSRVISAASAVAVVEDLLGPDETIVGEPAAAGWQRPTWEVTTVLPTPGNVLTARTRVYEVDAETGTVLGIAST